MSETCKHGRPVNVSGGRINCQRCLPPPIVSSGPCEHTWFDRVDDESGWEYQVCINCKIARDNPKKKPEHAMSTDDFDLKPCPFCGDAVQYDPYDPSVSCFSVGCEFQGPRGNNKKDAIALWNRRPPTETKNEHSN